MTHASMRIAVLQFSHETVSFLGNDTTLEDFIYPGSPAAGEALLGSNPRSYMGGFVKMAREFDRVELVGIESPLWPRTGTGSGWITNDAYETFVGKMLAGLRAQGGLDGAFDGVYLCLHGAMAVRGVMRPEADLARRVREVVGAKAFIAATFDLHGNEDEEFLKHADMAFAVKYFPHYDDYLQGERAARTLVRAIRGDYKPAHATVKVPIISPTVVQWTGASPWMDLVQRALVWEATEPDVYVNAFFGFPFADVPDVGMTFQVLTNGKPELAAKICRDMAATAWRGLARPGSAAHLDESAHHSQRRRPGEAGAAKRRSAGRSGRPQRPLRLCHLAVEGNHRAGSFQDPGRNAGRWARHRQAESPGRQGW
jgi:microcystin degradation protein MlrC